MSKEIISLDSEEYKAYLDWETKFTSDSFIWTGDRLYEMPVESGLHVHPNFKIKYKDNGMIVGLTVWVHGPEKDPDCIEVYSGYMAYLIGDESIVNPDKLVLAHYIPPGSETGKKLYTPFHEEKGYLAWALLPGLKECLEFDGLVNTYRGLNLSENHKWEAVEKTIINLTPHKPKIKAFLNNVSIDEKLSLPMFPSHIAPTDGIYLPKRN